MTKDELPSTMSTGRPYSENRSEPSVMMQFRVPKSWKRLIQEDASQQGMNLSEYIRFCLNEKHHQIKRRDS
ncbi:hypothetical protein MCC01967_00370 [Bifidobacteriaceae bacterium MCC01967]|nr:hypothetical protein MCC01967_00370 [Bifidobacteriaceae bacterium MCC01967]